MKKIDESNDAQRPPIRPQRVSLSDEVEASGETSVKREAEESPDTGHEAPLLPEILVVDAREDAASSDEAPANLEPAPPRIVDPARLAETRSTQDQAKRPWVNVHPRIPRALTILAVVVLVGAAGAFLLSKYVDPGARDQKILSLMDAQTPELNRHADPLPEIADELSKEGADSANSATGEEGEISKVQAADDPAAMGLDEAAFSAGDAREPLPPEDDAEALRCLIIKVEDAYIRANGKLVTLVELNDICRGLTDDCHTLKLINRHGDAAVVEHVVALLNQLELPYQFVKN